LAQASLGEVRRELCSTPAFLSMRPTPNASSLAAVVLLCCLCRFEAHSWVACTDYRGDVNHFQQEKCFGWPRQYRPEPRVDGYQIAVPDSRAFSGHGCDVPMSSPSWRSGYSPGFPHAVYEPGRVYCLAWPMKNHGWLPDSCTNAHSKSDAGVNDSLALFVSSVNPQTDATQAEFTARNINELAGLARDCAPGSAPSREMLDECQLGLEKHRDYQADCKGFLRTPRFCESSGRSMGTGCFRVPTGMAAGHYVAQWHWRSSFRPGTSGAPRLQTQAYASCFDFLVVPAGSREARPGASGTTGTPDSDLPCTNNALKFDAGSAAPAATTTPAPPPPPGAPAPTPAPPDPHSPPHSPCAGSHEVCAEPGLAPSCCVLGHACTHYRNSGYARCLLASSGLVPPTPTPTLASAPAQTAAPAATPARAACTGPHEVCAQPGWGPACCSAGLRCTYYLNTGYARCLPPALVETAGEARASVGVLDPELSGWEQRMRRKHLRASTHGSLSSGQAFLQTKQTVSTSFAGLDESEEL